jgi:NADH-quinone oxidoreductase subunit A
MLGIRAQNASRKSRLRWTPRRAAPTNLRVDGQLQQYLPVLILLGVAVAFAAGNLILSKLIGKRADTNPTKDTPYECGMPAEGEGAPRMSVKFYLVAMLFILFDIEVIFLFPWAVVYKDMLVTNAPLIFGSMISFLGILFVGYIYAVKKTAFDWKR